MRLRHLLFGGLVLGGSFFGALAALDLLLPGPETRPALKALPPLPAVSRNSTIVAPASIALTALRDRIERAAPRDLSGTRDNPLTALLSKAEIGYRVTRGPMSVAGHADQLTIASTLNGTFSVTGQLSEQASQLTGAVSELLGDNLGRNVQALTGRTLDQRAEVRGNVQVLSRPALLSGWRLDPRLSAEVAVANGGLKIAGLKLNVAHEVKPYIDKAVNEQVAALQQRLRADPFLETAMRREWARMCRAIPLHGAGLDNLWLELKPRRAFAAQPRIDATHLTLTLGIEAESRVVPDEIKPVCPFPATLDLVPPIDQGRLGIAVPIDLPFGEINKIIEAQFKGRVFPEDDNGPAEVKVRHATLAASGDRLLISLDVTAKEKKSWFGLGTDATVHVWGRPVLDPQRQILRFADLEVDVQSQAAFGLIGATARAAIPYLREALAQHAVIDLKPFAMSARQSIAEALADFRNSQDGIDVAAEITGLRLADIAFDSKVLRVIAEADGTARVHVTRLPGP